MVPVNREALVNSIKEPSVVCAASLDTKGVEAAWICQQLRSWGIPTILVDLSAQNPPQVSPDIDARTILSYLNPQPDQAPGQMGRGEAVATMAAAFTTWVLEQYQAGKILGILGLGGSGGTSLVGPAMRSLPIGFPKVLVSTLASGNTVPIIGTTDIHLVYPVVDVAGLNRVSRTIFQQAAAALAGMVQHKPGQHTQEKPTAGLTMFGVTTPCVEAVRKGLESQGWECLVFHATGTGGRAMESLVASGLIDAVLDITTTEVADEIAGGVFPGGPARMDAILQRGIPYLVSAGAMDMVNFGAANTVPDRYKGRKFHKHNELVTLMRTTIEENDLCGKWIAGKLARHGEGNWTVLLPTKGVSALDCEGKPFFDPAANQAFFDALETGLGPRKDKVSRIPKHINDPEFAIKILESFEGLVQKDPDLAARVKTSSMKVTP